MKRTNEAGYTLVSVLIIFLLFAIIGISLTTMSLSSVKASKTEQHHQSAFYIAEAGLNYKYHQLKDDFEKGNISHLSDLETTIGSMNNMPIVSFDDENKIDAKMVATGQETYADVMINPLPEISEYDFEIISTGHENNQTRTVRQTFILDVEDPSGGGGNYELPPVAVLTSGKLHIHGGNVNGSIATHSTEPGSVEFGYATINSKSEIIVPSDAPNNVLTKPNYRNDLPAPKKIDELWPIPNLPKFPDFPNLSMSNEPNILLTGNDTKTIVLNDSQKFNSIILKSNTTLTIDVGSSDKDIVIDNLIIEQGSVILKGQGTLNIYVNNELRFGKEWGGGGSSEIYNDNSKDPSKLNFFLKGSNNSANPKTISVVGAQNVYGSFFAEDANIELLNSGQIVGNIFTYGTEIRISGAARNQSQLILAPAASVTMLGSAKILGKVIAKSYSHPGNAVIDDSDPIIIEGPISPAALGIGNEGGSGGGMEQPPGQIQPGHAKMEPTTSLTEVNE